MIFLIMLVGSLYIGIMIYSYWRFYHNIRTKRKLQDIPTSKTTGVFIGTVELKGTAELNPPLISPFTGKECVYYSCSVAEEYINTGKNTDTDTDISVEDKPPTEVFVDKTGSKVIFSEEKRPVFYIQDDYGTLRINPEKADIFGKFDFTESFYESDPFYHRFGPLEPIKNSLGVRQFVEIIIPLHQEIYVMGKSRVRDDITAAEIAWNKEEPFFLISVLKENRNIFYYHVLAIISGLFFSALTTGAFLFLFGQKSILFSLITSAAILLITWFYIIHLSLVELRNRLHMAWANIDIELKRRYDLIPRLVSIISAMKHHEDAVLTACIRLCQNQSVQAKVSPQKQKIISILHSVLEVVEKYPNLRSNALFLNLQKKIQETEQRIVLAQRYYNDVVTLVNKRYESFPEILLADLSGLHKTPYFQIEKFEKVLDNVQMPSS